jgi:hypothetical protein
MAVADYVLLNYGTPALAVYMLMFVHECIGYKTHL